MMKKIWLFTLLILHVALFAEHPCLPEKSLETLLEGNRRFAEDQIISPDRGAYRRKSLTSTQKPFAAVLSCSDSRVPIEIIFDQGIGHIFNIRLAGNVLDTLVQESLDYAVHHLGVCLILVLGHENCGAVGAVLANQIDDIEDLANIINPAIKNIRESKEKTKLEKAIQANAIFTANHLKADPKFAAMIKEKKLQIYPAYYHLESGKVELLDQDAL